MKITQFLLFVILIVIPAVLSDDNDVRLENCGKRLEQSGSGNDTQDDWYGVLGRGSTYNTFTTIGLGAVTISRTHAIIDHSILKEKMVELDKSTCHEEQANVRLREDLYIYFMTSERDTSVHLLIRDSHFFGSCESENPKGFLVVKFEKPINLPYVCFPDNSWKWFNKSVNSYRLTNDSDHIIRTEGRVGF
ncbi:uncharacterized protein CELE_T04A6.3 [Caenorhabditis elegans]|uniref:Uncharacterized protein n=1 Tax=Caenorhabditis elegans TaxID=6239 RepID=C8JQP4_CAEEL|nr:Uncharacterized protein CELE_T04A6.3 [Caenorhabditis elegans]CCD73951.1 Uncharacterized protein CELE_T04A6.3 [Caenorhabditis elegans]|eukprot:NP_001254950.1 Uncharacterized protein CELE_T04A6.3 [Caenorhabditis elegans]